MISGGPKWIEQDGFDIVATADDAAPYTPEWLPDHVGVMLRSLLEERFNLVTHTEERPVRVWQLMRTKGEHKLTPADVNGVLRARDRSVAGQVAPPHGLILWAVGYDGERWDRRIPPG